MLLGLIDVIPWLAMLEQEMNSIERVKKYATLAQEADSVLPGDTALEHWPTAGAITFSNVEFKYRPDLPLVLKGLTFDVKAGEKVGIIGRTGAGKSSLVQAIYRTVELSGGDIDVDGVNLRNLGLRMVSPPFPDDSRRLDCPSIPRSERKLTGRCGARWQSSHKSPSCSVARSGKSPVNYSGHNAMANITVFA